jgi:acyl-CoA synthetase (AMP-forming)/AMP-acid ligase II
MGIGQMAFWNLRAMDDALAAIDARTGREWSYAQLSRDAARIGEAFPRLDRKSLGVLLAQNRYECLAAYLAALRNGSTAVILLDASLHPALLKTFLEEYRPDWIFTMRVELEFAGYGPSVSGEPGLLVNEQPQEMRIHPDLALLLSTSGSTGSPKLVRLTLQNLEANAVSITEYLGLTSKERPITSLPMPYSYGLSVMNSHLHAGAAIVLTEDGVLRREFWDVVDKYGCTSFAGVPYTYQLLLRAGLLAKKGASLKTLTQAGGRLEPESISAMVKLAGVRGWRFFVMYGQTEATARISYVPWEQLGGKIGSVGVPIPGGSLSIDETKEELIYEGPNVMMGYAECRADLAKGDELHGVLRTGDQARRDGDGYYYITGRLKRFQKMFGKRFNLDHVEKILAGSFGTAVACYGRDDMLIAAVEDCADTLRASETICQIFDLPRTAVKVVAVAEMPQTANGKLNYKRLMESSQEQETAAVRK